jgi:hypothetical protein
LENKVVERLKGIEKTQAVVEELPPEGAFAVTIIAKNSKGGSSQVT